MWLGNYSRTFIVDKIIENGPYSLVNVEQVFEGELNHSETLFAINFEILLEGERGIRIGRL